MPPLPLCLPLPAADDQFKITTRRHTFRQPAVYTFKRPVMTTFTNGQGTVLQPSRKPPSIGLHYPQGQLAPNFFKRSLRNFHIGTRRCHATKQSPTGPKGLLKAENRCVVVDLEISIKVVGKGALIGDTGSWIMLASRELYTSVRCSQYRLTCIHSRVGCQHDV